MVFVLKFCLYFCVSEPKKSRFRLHAAMLAVFRPEKEWRWWYKESCTSSGRQSPLHSAPFFPIWGDSPFAVASSDEKEQKTMDSWMRLILLKM